MSNRHTHSTIAGIEDSLAIAITALRLATTVRDDMDLVVSELEKQITALRTIREGPDAYPIDKPAGLRITITRR